jgi:hypothetical protein
MNEKSKVKEKTESFLLIHKNYNSRYTTMPFIFNKI